MAKDENHEHDEEERDHRAKEREYWQQQLLVARSLNWITAVAGIIAIVGLIILFLALLETRHEFQTSQRSQIVFGDESGVPVQLENPSGQVTNLVFHMKNVGRGVAREVVFRFALESAPPDLTITYSKVLYPPAPLFDPGVEVAAGESYTLYYRISKTKSFDDVETEKRVLRVVGRVTYRDDFGEYCKPVAWVYFLNPSRFQQELVPPKEAVCSPISTDQETLTADPSKRTFQVRFHLSEPLSETAPQPMPVPGALPFP
jgi:hypothetical protein